MSRKGENIYKRKDGRWEARYVKGTDLYGKNMYGSVYAKSYLEVKNKRNIMLQNGSLQPFSFVRTSYTLNDVLLKWLNANKCQLKPSSYQKYEGLIRNHVQNNIGMLPVSDITRAVLMNYSNELLLCGNVKSGGNLCPKTVNSILAVIGSALSWDEEVSYSFKISFLREERLAPQQFTPAEQKRLETYINANKNEFTLGVLLSLYTGMRIGEVCALQWADISDGVISVNKTMQRLRENDGHWRVIVTEPKTKSSARFIPVSTRLQCFLEEFSQDSGFVLRQANGKCIEPRLLQKWFYRILGEINVTQRTFHSLRHTFATRLIEQGCDPKTVSELLGHSSVQITLNRYVHPSMDMKKKAVNKIGKSGC